MADQQTFRNEDLVLAVSKSVDPRHFDMSKYGPFLDTLCRNREYQKEAVRTALRYMLGGRYPDLSALAEENYASREIFQERYGSFPEMRRHIEIPDRLAFTVDLATGTGKTFVMYALARIMLAEGAVDRVLVLCPSRTIEAGLLEKFRDLSGDGVLRDVLPAGSAYLNPRIIRGDESIVEGSICVENFHAALEHVNSSLRRTLAGHGERTLVLNDEVHHVYNRPAGRDGASQGLKKWKEFLLDPAFAFRYIGGFSGTCYLGDEYFSDVLYRYSLATAIEAGVVKSIDYTREDSSPTQQEKFQKIYDNHQENKNSRYRKVKPLTILVTADITLCKKLGEELTQFIAQQEGTTKADTERKVLVITSAPEHQANVRALATVDQTNDPVEWIISVSMLTEGWDVHNVFQIVPDEERAFNSKLLISQVLGRGLRVPAAYRGERPVVTVFNHDAWSGRIKHLVDEVMEIEKRLASHPCPEKQEYHFLLHNVAYERRPAVEEFQQEGEYEFTRDRVRLTSQVEAVERETVYERVVSGDVRSKKTLVHYRMHSVDDVAEVIHNRLTSIDVETDGETRYGDRYNPEWLRQLIRKSLRAVGETRDRVSEENRQRLLGSFGTIHRGSSKRVRYETSATGLMTVNTADRHRDSVGLAALRRRTSHVFYDERTRECSAPETWSHLQEALDDDNLTPSLTDVENAFTFKTPLNLVVTTGGPEYRFVRTLVRTENAQAIDAWIKSTDQGFYAIEYAWRQGEHTKRGFFNPDFFIRKGRDILVVEIKHNDELKEPSAENKGKYLWARRHFELLNHAQEELRYFFHFLTPQDYDLFFKFLREGTYEHFVSALDLALEEEVLT